MTIRTITFEAMRTFVPGRGDMWSITLNGQHAAMRTDTAREPVRLDREFENAVMSLAQTLTMWAIEDARQQEKLVGLADMMEAFLAQEKGENR